ncbi:phage head closure protein [Agrobacterium vitis]|uniref:phage head closure protein n=1 Tax=Agrobacterium vitis TaxID=373 RepID=UPI001F399346|nr:phage head closure protein [Agrobacterium vitis]
MGAFTMPDPGRMTARLTLEQPVNEPDGQGGVSQGWQAIAMLWALIEPQSFTREERGEAEIATIDQTVTIRFRTDVARGHRLVKGTRILAVRALRDPDESKRFLLLDCEEEVR